jgi:fatty-acyl-CoA synthase
MLWQIRTLLRAGMLPAMSPAGYFRAVRMARRYGLSPATTFAVSAISDPQRTAIVDAEGSSTWADLDRRSDLLATEFASMAANVEVPTIAVMARNSRPFVEVVIATAKLGGRILLLNTGFSGPQLAEVVEREGADIVVFDDEFRAVIGQLQGRCPLVVARSDAAVVEPAVTSLIDKATAGAPPPPRRPGKIVVLTSGTSGTPKGAERSGGSVGVGAISGFFDRIPLRRHGTVVVGAPMFHAWGLAGLTIGSSLACTIVTRRRFDPEQTLALVERHRATVLWLVPVMLERIMALPVEVRDRYDLSSLRLVALSGSAVRAEAVHRFMDDYGDIVYNNYSSTEVGWAAIATPADLREAPATAGRPPRGTELRVLDENGRPAPPESPGRIFVRNDTLFEGYTGGGRKQVVDGFMETGDVGHLDAKGRLYVDGRSDDMIVSGGENVYPAEVERLLGTHPSVLEVAVLGVPDEQYGQRLASFVVLDSGADPVALAEGLRNMVRDNLARHKIPRTIEVVDELPRNAAGKVVKRDLLSRTTKG